jgi:putative Holliday junction resolvase
VRSGSRPDETIAGIDLGTETIGTGGVGSFACRLASPRPVIKRRKFTIDAIELFAAFERDKAGGAVVIGLPVNMDGSEGPRAQATRALSYAACRRKSDLPFVFWDERLSTVAAERALIEMDVSRKNAQGADRFGGRELHSARARWTGSADCGAPQRGPASGRSVCTRSPAAAARVHCGASAFSAPAKRVA